jgi:hypothetical protein
MNYFIGLGFGTLFRAAGDPTEVRDAPFPVTA